MPENAAPLVSVAIPLYRSRPFVDCIMRNLGSIDYPNVEILISDRRQDDDALDVLAERCAGDTRVRLVRGRDGVGWVQHDNALLAAAAGEYFLWMPHDDSYLARIHRRARRVPQEGAAARHSRVRQGGGRRARPDHLLRRPPRPLGPARRALDRARPSRC